MEESKLIFSLDRHDEGPSVAFSKDKARESRHDIDLDLSQGRRSPTHYLPHSPSSPGSLSDLSTSSAGVLITPNLVKSSSTDLEPRESSSVRGKPLLSLVKSLSTEISTHGEPEVNLSKSDSKLHLHPRRQLTRSKISEVRPESCGLNKNYDWPSPPSAGSMSPTEPRGSSLMADFEDTRRKFSEAMQDPLSMLSKIMGDESSGSPKHGRTSSAGDSPSSQGSSSRERSKEDVDLKFQGRTDGESRVCDTPLRRRQRGLHDNHDADDHFETLSYEDVNQNKSTEKCVQINTQFQGPHRGPSLPFHWLILVGFLAYGFLVLPLPSYLTGLSIGVACGYALGLLVVFMFAQRRSDGRRTKVFHFKSSTDHWDWNISDPGLIQGWMNETYSYDPETFHPSVTHSVHVTLDGSRLRLAYPHANIPRWSTFDESPHEAEFCHSRSYELANSKVSLVPPGLARKRLWNKKYPICIALAEAEVVEETLVVEGQDEDERAERHVPPENHLPAVVYLFGRTGRDKEDWFQHFLLASRGSVSGEENEGHSETPSDGDTLRENLEELQDLPGAIKSRTLLDYSTYMAQVIGSESYNPASSPFHSDKGSPTTNKKTHGEEHASEGQAAPESSVGSGERGCSTEGQPSWVNALVGRIFWDFLREKYWNDQVAHKIQKKLGKIKLPYFMNELTLADLDMGNCFPQVLSTSSPKLDRRGLWLDMEVTYTGCLQMTLETKMDLCKLGKDGEVEAHAVTDAVPVGSKPRLCVLADSDEESSSAGSSDEEEVPSLEPVGEKSSAPAPDGHAAAGGSTSRKILRFVDKIAKSKYFQKATENKYIKKKIAEVSNMPLMLSVEVLELSGTLAVNIPPPPTDRIWYSFRGPPTLDLHVRPMFGEREVTLTHVTEWIEKKLQCEFQKVLVMPNMDDLYLPLMTSGLENPPTSHHSSVQSTSQQSSMESQDYMSE